MKNKIFILCCIFVLLVLTYNVAGQSAYGEDIRKANYEISRNKVERELEVGEIFKDSITISNLKSSPVTVSLYTSGEITGILNLDSVGGIITPNNSTTFSFQMIGAEIKNYIGKIVIATDINEEIPVNITVKENLNKTRFVASMDLIKNSITNKDKIDLNIYIKSFKEGKSLGNMTFSYFLIDQNNRTLNLIENETKYIGGSSQIRKSIPLPANLSDGFYTLKLEVQNKDDLQFPLAQLQIGKPFWSILLFGFLPMWLLALIISFIVIVLITIIFLRRYLKKRKKYSMELFTKTLPTKNDRAILLGKIAEKSDKAYLDLDALTTHAVVAGATGGGKSIAAQVLIEEALLKNIAVIVFDPTAQWSGMLRKCEDKKMLSFYSKFGLKPSDAKAFPGNVREVLNERQVIDVKKYMDPGHIQIFTLNRLTPQQMDVFVANVIASIFGSNPEEFPNLKMLLVFDEVHRLLPKFGGSGKGFLQIERACREFRKWGYGVMLVSQVLSDFVGEIKANINTEVQMRTRDESDLGRIKTKYGEEFLQSLVKASVGVGMFVNAKYNRGKPYFINFRPILHSTRRLSDEVLDKYNQYGEVIEDLEYQLEQLEALKSDIFDLKMELKLVKDKLTSGNFTVVDIYLEELNPRIKKQWDTLGKKPKKKELELVEKDILSSSLDVAKKEREKWGAQPTEKPAESKDTKPAEKSVEKIEEVKKEKVVEVKEESKESKPIEKKEDKKNEK